MAQNILHIGVNDHGKFISPFIKFVNDNQFPDEHTFLYTGGASLEKYPLPKAGNIIELYHQSKYIRLLLLLKYFHKADKVILHGLVNFDILHFLYAFPWLLKKCYWIMWGSDLYYHELAKNQKDYELFEKWRTRVIGKMGGLVTYIKGDYELAKKWYGAQGKYHECFMYPSNIYKEYAIKQKKHQTINIQIGNSADPTNNHLEIFRKLEKYKDEDIKIFVPLSYGDETYANEIIEQGRKIFGGKLEPITEFMPFDKYLGLLSEIDIAIFNHSRQQAMGNTITLLGLGKKIYMRIDSTPWSMFKDIGINVFDVANVTIDLLDEDAKKQNQKRIKEHFSKETYLRQLNDLFES